MTESLSSNTEISIHPFVGWRDEKGSWETKPLRGNDKGLRDGAIFCTW